MGAKGRKVSPEGRANMSKARTGIPKSEAHRRRISEGKMGKPRSEEAKRAISEGKKKYIFSEEHLDNLRSANWQLYEHTCPTCGQMFWGYRTTTMCSAECRHEHKLAMMARWRKRDSE